MSDWISVKDRLPDEDKLVLLANGEEVLPGKLEMYCGNPIFWVADFYRPQPERMCPKYWMPLPELPK